MCVCVCVCVCLPVHDTFKNNTITTVFIATRLVRLYYDELFSFPIDYSGSLKNALKEGSVVVKCTKLSISGPPGSGKSCLMKLLLNEDPPHNHDSTPVTTVPEVRMVKTTPYKVEETIQCWSKVDLDSLKQMVAEDIAHYLEKRCNNKLSTSSAFFKGTSQIIKTVSQSSESLSPSVHCTVKNEILHKLRSIKESPQLFKSHWIYAVDSGGQFAFLDIAPALLRYTSVNILTHKLNEKLEDSVKFYYSIDGCQIDKPEERNITHLQLLQSSNRSLVSFYPPKLRDITIEHSHLKPFCLVVGTFYDKIRDSRESLDEKDTILSPILKPFKKVKHIYSTFGEKIIALNATARGKEENKLANNIRDKIALSYIKADIPIRWFLFQIELEKYQKTPSHLISMSDCIKIGNDINMDKNEVESALMYYHDLTIYLYFPGVLDSVVFLNPQPLFNKLTQLISISFSGTTQYLERQGIIVPDGADAILKEKGIFSQKLLTEWDYLSQGFSHGIFSAEDFLKLMEHLYILSPLSDKPGEYFLPCVLPMTTTTDLENLRKYFKEKVDPLVLAWIDDDEPKPLPQGLFPALVVNLLSCKSSLYFKLLPPQSDKPQYRNAIRLSYSHGGTVLLIDTICWLEVLYTGQQSECYRICEVIKKGISAVVDKFHYMHNLKDPEERFHCSICTTTEHLCRLSEDKKVLTCCINDTTCFTDERRQLIWLKTEVKSEFILVL